MYPKPPMPSPSGSAAKDLARKKAAASQKNKRSGTVAGSRAGTVAADQFPAGGKGKKINPDGPNKPYNIQSPKYT